MKKLLLSSVLMVSTFYISAQDQNWSVEVNYPINLSQKSQYPDGTLDAAIKYRFYNTEIVHVGLDLNGGVTFEGPGNNNEEGFKSNIYFFQPKVFVEFDLPFIPRLHPSIGLGYSIINSKFTGPVTVNDEYLEFSTSGGLNFDIGFAYDISQQFFVQAKYDLVNINGEATREINGI